MQKKIKIWIKRYLPAEISSIVLGFVITLLSYHFTQNKLLSAYIGTIADNLGYYGFLFLRDFKQKKNRNFFKILKNIYLEFGIAEFFDSLFIRAFSIYFFSNLISPYGVGVIIGKICADIIFYMQIIFVYEMMHKRKKQS